MENFTYYNPAKIIFGKDSEKNIAQEILPFSSKVLLVHGKDSLNRLKLSDALSSQFEKKNIKIFDYDKVVPNPHLEHVKEAIDICRNNQIGFVLAIGGGSAIDTAKAIAIGVPYEGDVWDFYTGKAEPKTALPIGTLLTLPSSGSEMSNASIISNKQEKLGCEHELLIPKFSILNPLFTLSLPPYPTYVGIVDIFSHLLERYFSNSQSVHLTDFLLEGVMQSLLINASKLHQNMHSYEIRAEIMWTASVAHNNLLDTGRISDWGSHRIEHELSARYDIAHGEGMAIIFPAWMSYAAEHKPEKLAQLAVRVFHYDSLAYSKKELASLAVKKVQEFFTECGMHKNLSELGIDETDFSIMAQKAVQNGSVGHYIVLNSHIIESILAIALRNDL